MCIICSFPGCSTPSYKKVSTSADQPLDLSQKPTSSGRSTAGTFQAASQPEVTDFLTKGLGYVNHF